jgi:hypothetical protein
MLQMEMVQDQPRLKMSIIGMKPIEYAKESRALLAAIKEYDTK